MLVDASKFPAPAAWQGLMLIVVAVWVIWLFTAKPSPKAVRNATVLLMVIGVILMPITYYVFKP